VVAKRTGNTALQFGCECFRLAPVHSRRNSPRKDGCGADASSAITAYLVRCRIYQQINGSIARVPVRPRART
jgi:hypothetical protein